MATIFFTGRSSDHECGYCKSEKGYKTIGMVALTELGPEPFQCLMDRGWRRCGDYFYQPIIGEESCCSLYTIRLDTRKFEMGKSQKKVLRKMKRFLDTEWMEEETRGFFDEGLGDTRAFPPRKRCSEALSDVKVLEKGVVRYSLVRSRRELTITEYPTRVTDESFQLYKKYQMAVHKDKPEDLSQKSYDNFLCSGPLEYRVPTDEEEGIGQFHWEYRISGRLVAVSVLDKTRYCMSSVYSFYDPIFSFLSLGTYTALREIEYLRQIPNPVRMLPTYYYMGFYIPNCQKMVYKANFRPAELLCPTTLTFVQFSEAFPKIERDNRALLLAEREEGASATPVDAIVTKDDVNNTMVSLMWNSATPLQFLKDMSGHLGFTLSEGLDDEIMCWMRGVGRENALKFVYFITRSQVVMK